MLSENEIEKEIQDRNLNAPRLSPENIDLVIKSVHYEMFSVTRITLCTITLNNGFTVCGINNGPVSAENFNIGLAKKLSYQKARNEIWPLEGYLLAQRRYEERMAAEMDDDILPF